MIAPGIVAEIRRLLADDKLSQRKIARAVGVSRGTVAAIASGTRPDYEAIYQQALEDQCDEPAGPPQRCPECGVLVYMPCQACRARKSVTRRPRLLVSAIELPELIVELDLRPEHRARYEEVRAWREAAEAEAADESQTNKAVMV